MMDSRQKMLFLVPLPPPVHGAAAVSESIRQSRRINEAFDCDFVNLSLSRTVSEIGTMSAKKIWRFVSAFSKTFHNLLHNRYDLCYIALTCYGTGFLKDAPFALLCKLFCKKLVIHQHNKGMVAYADKLFYKPLLKAVYKDAMVILLSWNLFPDISAIVKRDQILICPNGIKNSSRENTIHQQLYGRILFVSNLILSKGPLQLLDACSILKERGLDFSCEIIGKESGDLTEEAFKDAISSRNLDGLVFYSGYKDGEAKEEAFRQADIFIHPTANDCFPLVILEAMQHSIPVISTNVGGIPDMISDGENGIICQDNAPGTLADALESLLRDKAKATLLGNNARETFEKKFTSDNFEKRLYDCLSKSMQP